MDVEKSLFALPEACPPRGTFHARAGTAKCWPEYQRNGLLQAFLNTLLATCNANCTWRIALGRVGAADLEQRALLGVLLHLQRRVADSVALAQ